jgi:sucrose phosphorylase
MDAEGLDARIAPLVERLYPDRSDSVRGQLVALADKYAHLLSDRHIASPSHETVYLITYGDGIRRSGETPLHTLAGFLHDQVGDVVSDVHLLPMFPWTSDDGFAVVDHRAVNPALGTWADVADLAEDHPLMFDFVANHTSSSSPWFLGWLAQDPAFQGYYLERDDSFDTSRVVRPRTTPLFHPFQRPGGDVAWAWTTFGEDQVDVDVRTPQTLLELTDVLLGYLRRGASTIRLDAIGFLWKESGTTCLHLPQTHAVIKLWRAIVDAVLPGAQLITETNVPHAENVSYFGDGTDEASLVYQFALPPLVLHSFVAGSTARLADWATGIGPVSRSATWFNFLASHDGIGLRASEGILDEDERSALVRRIRDHGGRVSMALRPDGTSTVYELNLSYLDALCTPEEARDPRVLAAKTLAAHSILLAFVGVPAIYYHSLVGSSPDHDGMVETGISRRINRGVLDADRLVHDLEHEPRRREVFTGMRRLLRLRRTQPALSPYADQSVERLDDRVLALRRGTGTPDELLCVTNVTDEPVDLPGISGYDVVTAAWVDALVLPAWGFAWLRSNEPS